MQDAPSNDHRRVWDAIPWVVAGAASVDDTQLVQTHLPACAECQDEWALHQRVHAGLQGALPQALPSPQAGWQKLLARLDSVAPEDLDRRAANTAPRTASTRWTRWLVAAVVVQAIGLGASGLALWDRGQGGLRTAGAAAETSAESGTGSTPGYRTLSQAPETLPAASLRVVPAPALDFATLRDLLAQTRLMVVEIHPDGSSLGLAPVDGEARTAHAALPALRASPAVMLAEPLSAAR